MKLQLRTRFIHVGVDTSRYALLIGGRSLYPLVLVKLLCLRSVWSLVVCKSVCLSLLVIVCVWSTHRGMYCLKFEVSVARGMY